MRNNFYMWDCGFRSIVLSRGFRSSKIFHSLQNLGPELDDFFRLRSKCSLWHSGASLLHTASNSGKWFSNKTCLPVAMWQVVSKASSRTSRQCLSHLFPTIIAWYVTQCRLKDWRPLNAKHQAKQVSPHVEGSCTNKLPRCLMKHWRRTNTSRFSINSSRKPTIYLMSWHLRGPKVETSKA